MMLEDPGLTEISYVCENMRQSSHDEIFGVHSGSPMDFARYLDAAPGFKWVGYHAGRPAALIGAIHSHGGVWGLFGFGTDDWHHIWRQVTRTARKDMMQAVIEAGAHRAHCATRADHVETHRWLRALGAVREEPLPQYGRAGEDYIMFVWLKDLGNVRTEG